MPTGVGVDTLLVYLSPYEATVRSEGVHKLSRKGNSLPMRVILDRGHGHKADGAPFDPGVTHGKAREVDLAAGYIQHAVETLRAAGHEVFVLDTGTYDARHAQAIALAAESPEVSSLYVQCHVNGGRGTYAVVEHDARSDRGRAAATCLVEALKALPEISKVRRVELKADDRGWACIDDIHASKTMCGVLYEPFFIDAPAHAALLSAEGLARVGEALAAGIERYSREP